MDLCSATPVPSRVAQVPTIPGCRPAPEPAFFAAPCSRCLPGVQQLSKHLMAHLRHSVRQNTRCNRTSTGGAFALTAATHWPPAPSPLPIQPAGHWGSRQACCLLRSLCAEHPNHDRVSCSVLRNAIPVSRHWVCSRLHPSSGLHFSTKPPPAAPDDAGRAPVGLSPSNRGEYTRTKDALNGPSWRSDGHS